MNGVTEFVVYLQHLMKTLFSPHYCSSFVHTYLIYVYSCENVRYISLYMPIICSCIDKQYNLNCKSSKKIIVLSFTGNSSHYSFIDYKKNSTTPHNSQNYQERCLHTMSGKHTNSEPVYVDERQKTAVFHTSIKTQVIDLHLQRSIL